MPKPPTRRTSPKPGSSLRLEDVDLSQLIDQFADAVIVADVETGTIQAWNRAAAAMFGYRGDEVLGELIEVLMPPEARARHSAGMAHYRGSATGELIGSGHTMALQALHSSGRRFPIDLSLSPLDFLAPPARRVMALIRDTSEREGVAARLREREAQLAEAQRLAGLGSWEWDIPADRVTWSDELYRIFGIQPGEFGATYQAYLGFVVAADRPLAERTVAEGLRDGRPFTYSCRIRRHDGELRVLHVSGAAAADDAGKVVRMRGAVLDVTDLHRLEDDLRAKEQVLRGIFNQTFEFIGLLDPAGTVLDVNDTALVSAGIPREAVVGRPFWEAPWWSHSAALQERLRAAIAAAAAGRLDRFEATHPTVDGTLLTIDFSIKPLRDAQGAVVMLIPEGRDVSQRRLLEDTLREQYERLQRTDALKDEFVNAVSHDLRTPLTAITGYAEFLEEATGLTPDQRGYVAQIQKSCRRLELMVDDLLDAARLDAGSFSLFAEEVDLAALVVEAVESLEPLIAAAGLKLELVAPAEPAPASVDPSRVERVLFNLISNAIKFNHAGGSIRVEVKREGTMVRTEVADTGTGIAAADLPRLFKRFSQLEAGSRERGGTGLGLSIGKAIVEAHGGCIDVASEEGRGSRFWFLLPASG